MYLTGGIGAAGSIEGFGPAYTLPNAEAYCETCASIGIVLWNHRLFLRDGDARYIDILERTLYNGFLSGVSLSGDRFFYPNPLESRGRSGRSPWFDCACCPSNITRFVPQIPSYVYAVSGDSLYVNLYAASEADVRLAGRRIRVRQETLYPWDGEVKIEVAPASPGEFEIAVRIPGWAEGRPVPGDLYSDLTPASGAIELRVNGDVIPVSTALGYTKIRRVWKAGDTIDLSLPMPVRRVVANAEVKADAGRVAVERGPLVYCAEWPDNGGQVENLVLSDEAPLTPEKRADLLGGVTVVAGQATALVEAGHNQPVLEKKQSVVLIPYYAWAHRGRGEMTVWLPRDVSGARPLPPVPRLSE